MIAYVKGEITFKSPTYIIVEANGIGYRINITLNTYAQVEKLERVKLLTHFYVKEDQQTLYGFAENVERRLFLHLISVSGIGPSTARVMLSGMSTDELRSAIISENVAAFKKVKGIGPKTAKRLILDLKDKLIKESGEEGIVTPAATTANNKLRQEALSALVALGYVKIQAQKTLNKVLKTKPDVDSVEKLIKFALNELR
ncbi:MAG: Holliday junction branch migration protein RuvA [Saprospiraceae bacterium]